MWFVFGWRFGFFVGSWDGNTHANTQSYYNLWISNTVYHILATFISFYISSFFFREFYVLFVLFHFLWWALFFKNDVCQKFYECTKYRSKDIDRDVTWKKNVLRWQWGEVYYGINVIMVWLWVKKRLWKTSHMVLFLAVECCRYFELGEKYAMCFVDGFIRDAPEKKNTTMIRNRKQKFAYKIMYRFLTNKWQFPFEILTAIFDPFRTRRFVEVYRSIFVMLCYYRFFSRFFFRCCCFLCVCSFYGIFVQFFCFVYHIHIWTSSLVLFRFRSKR